VDAGKGAAALRFWGIGTLPCWPMGLHGVGWASQGSQCNDDERTKWGGGSDACLSLGWTSFSCHALPCQYFPLRACLCQLCACMFLAAHQIALCLYMLLANSACVLQVVGLT
jgi:hypothetical protein